MLDITSAPIDQRVLVRAGRHHLAAVVSAVGERRAGGAEIEAPRVRARRSCACTRHAVLGNIMSGVIVPTTMKPMSSGVRPACSIAFERRLLGRGPTSPRRDRRCGARGCRCAAGSTRRWSRPSSRDRRWSARAAARRSPATRSSSAGRRTRGAVGRVTTVVNPFFGGRVEPEIAVGARRRHAAARRAIEEADLDQERLVDVLDRVLLFADRRRDAC